MFRLDNLYQNVRKALPGLYKRDSNIELKYKVQTMVLFLNK